MVHFIAKKFCKLHCYGNSLPLQSNCGFCESCMSPSAHTALESIHKLSTLKVICSEQSVTFLLSAGRVFLTFLGAYVVRERNPSLLREKGGKKGI